MASIEVDGKAVVFSIKLGNAWVLILDMSKDSVGLGGTMSIYTLLSGQPFLADCRVRVVANVYWVKYSTHLFESRRRLS